MPSRAGRRLGCRLSLAVLALMVLPATPAAAHPFGPPPVATLEASGHQLRVYWRAESDDLVALGLATGALGSREVFVYDAHGQLEEGPAGDTAEERLPGAPELETYLREHVGVMQAGVPCRAGQVDTAALPEGDARLVYDCPELIRSLQVSISTLTDLDPAYRTVSLSAGPNAARSIHTKAEPVATVAFASDEDEAAPTEADTPTPPWTLVTIAGVVTATRAAIAVGRRRRRPAR